MYAMHVKKGDLVSMHEYGWKTVREIKKAFFLDIIFEDGMVYRCDKGEDLVVVTVDGRRED